MIDERSSGFAPILRQAAGPRIQIEFRLSGAAGASLIDPVQLEASSLNLVLNARDAMPEGGTIVIETETVVGSGTDPARGRKGGYGVVADHRRR